TTNRAKLRAAVDALRFCDWKDEGFNMVVIGTDSTYVVDGATSQLEGWVSNGWTTIDGGDVKDKDLWGLLLGEVDTWLEQGVLIEFW
ncbi:hypothetical protein B0T16DRAFT_294559, partial [Cercophora newfieldiana]